MSKTHVLTNEELAKIIAVSIKGFAEANGINLPPKYLPKIKDATLRSIDLFEDAVGQVSPENETFAQEFVRIYDEDVKLLN